jgi:5,6-dimethylbenzimidazole synthase
MAFPQFDADFQANFRALLAWRRDVREFRTDQLPDGLFESLVEMACLAPSVGLSQPWRFVRVDDLARRAAVRDDFARCNADALSAQPADRSGLYARLKLAGFDQAPVQFAVFCDRLTEQGNFLGRRTMPEMAEYSTVAAIHTLWLAARLYGIGLGWISILDPAVVAHVLDVPADWRFIGYFCLGYPAQFDDVPALERLDWEHRKNVSCFIVQR